MLRRPGGSTPPVGQVSPATSASPAVRSKTPVWREVHDKVLAERGLGGSGAPAGLHAAPAEPVAQPTTAKQANPADAVFGILDRNHDGVISRTEWNQAMHGGQVSYAVGTRPAYGGSRPSSAGPPAGAAGAAAVGAPPQRAPMATGGGDIGSLRRSLAANTYRVQALAGEDGGAVASPERPGARSSLGGDSPAAAAAGLGVARGLAGGGAARPQTSMQDLRRGLASHRQEQDLQVAFVQDAAREAEQARSSLLSASGDRHRQADSNEQQRLQTAELQQTVAELKSEASRLQAEQRRQAKFIAEQSKKGGSEVSPQIVRQVETFKGVVETQEQKLSRIEASISEATATQRAQLREALEQGRQLSRSIEDEAARRQQGLGELQQLIIQERNRDSSLPAKLQGELNRATQAMQSQTGEWLELARVIKTEVGSLAGELRSDREARALEASSQRYELARMIEETRLANVASTVGGYGCTFAQLESDLGMDMMSKAGSVAVHKLVDTTKGLMHGLEQALLLRAGFMASAFHTWRFEIERLQDCSRYQDELGRYQEEWNLRWDDHRREFEDQLRRAAEYHLSHKEIMRERTDLLLMKWARGEAEGLRTEVFLVWKRFALQEKRLRRTAKSIHKGCSEWIAGSLKALLLECFGEWKHLTGVQIMDRQMHGIVEEKDLRFESAMAKVQREADERIAEGLAKLQARDRRAKSDLYFVISKWEKGVDLGLLQVTLQGWVAVVTASRLKQRQSNAAQMALQNMLTGQSRAALSSCWQAWKKDIFFSKEMEAERRRFEELMNGHRSEREKAERDAQDAARAKLQAAHEAVQMALAKFELGDKTGLLRDIFKVWSRWSQDRSQADRRRKSVMVQLGKWTEGDERGLRHTCFMNWKALAMEALREKGFKESLEKERQSLEALLSDERKRHMSEIDAMRSEEQRRKDEAHAVTESLIARWAKGSTKGLMTSVLKSWCTSVKSTKDRARKRNAAHQAMLRSFVGESRALSQTTFWSWKSLVQEITKGRNQEEQIALERSKWEEREKELILARDKVLTEAEAIEVEAKAKAHAASELLIKKWLGGDSQGILSTVFADWRRLKDTRRTTKRKRQSVADSMTRFFLGESRGRQTSVLRAWRTQVEMARKHSAEIGRLEKQVEKLLQKHEVHLTKYAGFLGAANGPVLKGMVLSAWRDVSKGIRMLEVEREKEVALQELKLERDAKVTRKKEVQVQVARSLGAKTDKLLLAEVFLVWKWDFEVVKMEKMHKLNSSKAMKQLATQMIMRHFKEDASALKTSCFEEWRREGKALRAEEATLDVQRRLEEYANLADEWQFRSQNLEEQLRAAYKHVDHITETLQKELQTKAELTEDLREAYDKMRSCVLTPTTGHGFDTNGVSAFSRPSSAQSRSHSTGRLDGTASGRRSLGAAPQARAGPSDGVFDVLDRNHDGVISRSEWHRAMGSAGDTAAALVSPSTLTFARPGRSTTSSGSAVAPAQGPTAVVTGRSGSPARCDWDEVLKKLKEERLLGASSKGGGVPQEPISGQ